LTNGEDYGGPSRAYLATCNPLPFRHNVHMDEAITPSQTNQKELK